MTLQVVEKHLRHLRDGEVLVEVQLRVDAVSYGLTLDHLRMLKEFKSESRVGTIVNAKLWSDVETNTMF